MARALGDRYDGLCVALVNGAVNRLSLGDLDHANALAVEARTVAAAIGATSPRPRQCTCWRWWRTAGRSRRRARHPHRRARARRARRRRQRAALVFGSAATILRERGDLPGALAAHLEEQVRYESIGSATGWPRASATRRRLKLAGGRRRRRHGAARRPGRPIAARSAGPRASPPRSATRPRSSSTHGDAAGAEAKILEQQAVAQKAGLKAAEANAIGVLGVLKQNAGDLDGALAEQPPAGGPRRQMGDPWLLAMSLGNQSTIARARGDVASAVALLQRRVEVLRGVGHDDELLKTMGELAACSSTPANREGRSRSSARQSRSHAPRGPIPSTCALSSTASASPNLQLGQADDAERVLVEARALNEAASDVAGTAAALQNLALLAHGRGDLAGALATHRAADPPCPSRPATAWL